MSIEEELSISLIRKCQRIDAERKTNPNFSMMRRSDEELIMLRTGYEKMLATNEGDMERIPLFIGEIDRIMSRRLIKPPHPSTVFYMSPTDIYRLIREQIYFENHVENMIQDTWLALFPIPKKQKGPSPKCKLSEEELAAIEQRVMELFFVDPDDACDYLASVLRDPNAKLFDHTETFFRISRSLVGKYIQENNDN